MTHDEIKKKFNTKQKVDKLRSYLHEIAVDAEYDDARDTIIDMLWSGSTFKGYAHMTLDELIDDLVDPFVLPQEEEDLKEAIDDALTGSR